MSEIEIFYPASLTEWRKWLTKNHLSKQSVWLVFHTKSSEKKSITWSEAVDVALCFGWIDSKKIKIDNETSHQFFSKRKPNSTWSKINKEKVLKLIDNGLMINAGYESIETAKQNGSWTILDEVEELVIPKDLEKVFKKYKGSKAYFLSLSKTIKKNDVAMDCTCQTTRYPPKTHRRDSRTCRTKNKTQTVPIKLSGGRIINTKPKQYEECLGFVVCYMHLDVLGSDKAECLPKTALF